MPRWVSSPRLRHRHAAFFVASLPVPAHSGHSQTMRSPLMTAGTYVDPWHSGHASSARSCSLRHALYIDGLPVVVVRSLDQERARSRRRLGRWLVVCDRRADVIGRSEAIADIAALSAHGPVSDQLCRIHLSLRPAMSEATSPLLGPSARPWHGIPLTGQEQSLERGFFGSDNSSPASRKGAGYISRPTSSARSSRDPAPGYAAWPRSLLRRYVGGRRRSAARRAGRDPSGNRDPFVQRVGLALLVASAVRQLDEP